MGLLGTFSLTDVFVGNQAFYFPYQGTIHKATECKQEFSAFKQIMVLFLLLQLHEIEGRL